MPELFGQVPAVFPASEQSNYPLLKHQDEQTTTESNFGCAADGPQQATFRNDRVRASASGSLVYSISTSLEGGPPMPLGWTITSNSTSPDISSPSREYWSATSQQPTEQTRTSGVTASSSGIWRPRHVVTSTPLPSEEPFQCPTCWKVFTTKYSLGDHILTHAGERLYKCSYCPRNFSHKASARRHARTHKGHTQ